MSKDKWVPVNGFEGLYEVSDKGEIQNCTTGKNLKFKKDHGYLRVCLCKEGIKKTLSVHRIVLSSFDTPRDLQVNHIDENKTNNNLDNLEWCTSRYNCNYGSRNSLISENSGSRVKVINKVSGKETIYNSLLKASLGENMSRNYFQNMFKNKGITDNNRFKIEYLNQGGN